MKSYFRNWNSLTRGALYNFNKLLKYVNVIQFDYARNSSIMDAAMNGVRNPPPEMSRSRCFCKMVFKHIRDTDRQKHLRFLS